MTTAISDIHDELHTIVATALTGKGYSIIPNAYIAPDNAGLLLKKGYGIAVGPGTNTQRTLAGKLSFQRDFQVFLTALIPATSNNYDARFTAEKTILEDFALVLLAIEQAPSLNENSATSVLLNDGGLEYLEGDRDKYYLIESTVTVEYVENVNC